MDEEEQNRYVAQLKEEFDSCDTTGTGYLDKEELSVLCQKLHLDAHLPLMLDTLLGPHHYARVNFEEFKEGFVAVLSRSLEFSTSEEDSSYLEPVIPEEVQPKFVKGAKRYGRKSRPDRPNSERTADTDETGPFHTDPSETTGVRRAKLRRSTSLESVESLKSDEETGSNKEAFLSSFEAQGQQKRWKPDSTGSGLHSPGLREKVTDGQVRAVWEELGVGAGGSLSRQELSLVCEHIGLKNLQSEELDALFRKLDKDQDGRVSLQEFQIGLFNHGDLPAPKSSSTPLRPKAQLSLLQAFDERVARSTSPSLLSATVGQKLLTRLDDGSGCTSPERVIALWTEEGIRNSRDILQTLDFSLDERLSLVELTLALDNELLVSGNGIHQAALISYKNEIHFLQTLADQACRERDKAKADLEWADRRNLQLVREVDDRHATMESLNETKIKGLEQDFREKLTALRSETEQESEVLMQQLEWERVKLREEVEALQAKDVSLQEEVCNVTQENARLEDEASTLKGKLAETESTVARLQKDLEHLLQDKFASLDQSPAVLENQEERFSDIIKEYEVQCRELRDRNDELSSELEMLKNQTLTRKPRRSRESLSSPTWSGRRALANESDSDDPEMKKGSSPQVKKKLEVENKSALGSLESLSAPVSIETELAMEQLKEKYEQEVQDLKIQLETKVNFYERSMELMRRNMEVERKDISQSFKVEISELEEQKAQAEERAERLKQSAEKLEAQLQARAEGLAWGSELDRRLQRERAELEQNYAREMSNIVQRLTSEKDQLEAELKLKMDQEVLLVREEMDRQLCQCKQQYSEAQRSLLHQLHCERRRLHEQGEQQRHQQGRWEARLHQLEQEARRERLRHEERTGEEQAQICHGAALEKRRLDQSHQEEVQLLREEIHGLRTRVELEERAEVEAQELRKRLEAKLEEMCEQLEENTVHLKSQDAAIQRLTSDLLRREKELEAERTRAEELLRKLSHLTQELDSAQAEAAALRSEKELIEGNCNHLSSAFALQQAQFKETDEEMSALRANMEKSQEVVRLKEAVLTRQVADLEVLQAERTKLGEQLRRQTTDMEHLQTRLQSLTTDLEQMRKSKLSLQEAFRSEQSKVTDIRSTLELDKEERDCLTQENAAYRGLTNQLSAQIVEMEAEADGFREDVQRMTRELGRRDCLVEELRAQLDAQTAEMEKLWAGVQRKVHLFEQGKSLSGEVEELRGQLVDKEKELSAVRQEVDGANAQLQKSLEDLSRAEEEFEREKTNMREQLLEMENLVMALEEAEGANTQLQKSLERSQEEQSRVEEEFDGEKTRMREQLLEMEKLVMALEEGMDPASPHRAKLDDVNSENCALKDRLTMLQQDVKSLEEEVDKKRRRLDEMEREHEKERQEEEKLHKENAKYREEVLDLSSRNLQLSTENAELSSRLRADQGAVQMLTERLAQVCREQEDGKTTMRQLQEVSSQQERDGAQLQASWKLERERLERELTAAKEKIQQLSEVELEHQWLQQDNERLLKEAEERKHKVEKLQESLHAVDTQTEQLRSQLQAASQESHMHNQETAALQRMLQDSQDKVRELEMSMGQLCREKEELQRARRQHEDEASRTMEEECQRLHKQNQDLLQKVAQLQAHEKELRKLTQECLTLKHKQTQLETATQDAKNQALQADTALSVAQAQHVRALQDMREQVGAGSREQLGPLQAQLAGHQRRGQQLEEMLRSQAQKASTQLALQQEQYEKVMGHMQERMEEVEAKLKNVRMMLQEKVNQLKEQLTKNAKSDLLLKDLYVENSQLMKALQITEQRQKSAEKKSFLLEEKVAALNKLLRKIAPASLSA
ncbi:ninein-like protein [Alosa sapidissima]|uniref:ninein-like protein n=1 Tax=Alosa sapidissima TaxID=34773 RepID=UPI001C09D0FC|nr:ninein-like protein [Alosa sapidissima]